MRPDRNDPVVEQLLARLLELSTTPAPGTAEDARRARLDVLRQIELRLQRTGRLVAIG